jgi:hypothetical protein
MTSAVRWTWEREEHKGKRSIPLDTDSVMALGEKPAVGLASSAMPERAGPGDAAPRLEPDAGSGSSALSVTAPEEAAPRRKRAPQNRRRLDTLYLQGLR